MALPTIIAGLDIGSSAIRIVVAQSSVKDRGMSSGLTVIGAIETPSQGISKSSVTSLDDAVSSVSKALEQAERMTGQAIPSVWVGIGGAHIIAQESKGVVGVARSDGEIREEDVERAVDAARTVATPTNHDILHVIPRSFTVDGQRGVIDPIGMTGVRLEADALIIEGLTSQVRNISKCVFRTGLNIEHIIFSILAVGESVLSSKQKELGSVVVNLGAQTTSVIVFEEGNVTHVGVLPIGADHITSDIAIALRTSIEVAETIKKRYGTAIRQMAERGRKISVKEFGALGDETCTQGFMADVINARVEEIFEKVDQELRKIDRSGLLPAGAFLTGGGAKLSGIGEVAKGILRLPVAIGLPLGIQSAMEEVNDPSFATAMSLVKWADEAESNRRKHFGGGAILNTLSLNKVGDFMKKVLKGFTV